MTGNAVGTMAGFVRTLVCTSEKAANLARAIRAEQDLFSLLVQEKDSGEKNTRFVQDFKTLADVLIQETIKHDLSRKFSEISPCDIHGEESSKFTNALGESINVGVKATCQDTAALLCRVLNSNVRAANLLAAVVHSDVCVQEDDALHNLQDVNLPLHNFGIWIDPIDSTAEYIHGKDEDVEDGTVCAYGLPCVTVLIGVYDKNTGDPVIGVVNQPFYKLDPQTGKWVGRNFWGVRHGGQRITSIQALPISGGDRRTVLISGSESKAMKKLLAQEYDVLYAAGAGYKLLCVTLGLADAYILSRGTTFRWDSCAPHALLKSVGGGVVSYQKVVSADFEGQDQVGFDKHLSKLQLNYHAEEKGRQGAQKWCNTGGIVAYRDSSFLRDLAALLRRSRSEQT